MKHFATMGGQCLSCSQLIVKMAALPDGAGVRDILQGLQRPRARVAVSWADGGQGHWHALLQRTHPMSAVATSIHTINVS